MMTLMNDLNVLTNIPERSLDRMARLIVMSICTGVWEDKQSGNPITEVDTGIGVLRIKKVDEEFKFAFEPSGDFHKELKKAYKSATAPIMPKLMNALRNGFMEVYKEIC